MAPEMEAVARGERETDKQYEARRNAAVVFKRYYDNQELLNKLYATRCRFTSQLGKKAAVPFEELRTIVHEIQSSAISLTRLWSRDNFPTGAAWKIHYSQVREHEAILWQAFKNDDPTADHFDAVIS